MTCAINALVGAVIETAKADLAIAALCGDRIYEELPRDPRGDAADVAAPYVYLSFVHWADIESSCGPIYAVTLQLRAVSTKFGRKECRDLMQAVTSAFNRKTLTLADGHEMTLFRATSGGDIPGDMSPKECFVDLRAEVSDAAAYVFP